MYFNLNSKLLPGKNTQKVNKQKFVFRKIGSSHELKEIFVMFLFSLLIRIHVTCQDISWVQDILAA